MSSEAMDGSADAERLSALVDGELDGAATEEACRRWKGDAQARRTWYSYHLIGDVLRSDDLAAGARHDGRFLVALRSRLEAEPVVLAPAPLPAVPSRVAAAVGRPAARWMMPSAIAAGLVLVVGTAAVLRPGGSPPPGAPVVSVADTTSAEVPAAPLRAVSIREAAEPAAMVMSGKVIRDARLDRYLAAHKQFSGSSALGLPSAFLRSATVESDGR
jgi:sigma-E factor negative regulatory protein RseA